jgi:hypothetical protein
MRSLFVNVSRTEGQDTVTGTEASAHLEQEAGPVGLIVDGGMPVTPDLLDQHFACDPFQRLLAGGIDGCHPHLRSV